MIFILLELPYQQDDQKKKNVQNIDLRVPALDPFKSPGEPFNKIIKGPEKVILRCIFHGRDQLCFRREIPFWIDGLNFKE
jgi:hypothetical protein